MSPFIVISLLAGMVLGQRFKVLVLAPAIAFMLTITIGAGIARADAIWAIGLAAVATITSLQIGYFVGTSIQHLLIVARPRPADSGSARRLEH